MNVVARRSWLLALALPLVLTACFDKEPKQREAFSEFLQTRVLDKKGIRVPKLTAAEKESFGPYAEQYQVIQDFHTAVDKEMNEVAALAKKASAGGLQDILEKPEDLKAAKEAMEKIAAQFKERKQQLDATRAKFDQPEDLKAVYDKVYEKLITAPTNVIGEVIPQGAEVLGSQLKLADFVAANKDKVEMKGSFLQAADQAVLDAMNPLLKDMQDKSSELMKAQKRVTDLMYGN